MSFDLLPGANPKDVLHSTQVAVSVTATREVAVV